MTADTTIAAEASALSETAGLRARDDLLAVRVRGEDRLTWLNGQITNDVRELAPGASVYALAVNVRGKIMADLWVLQRDDELCVLLPSAAADTVLASFDRQIIMDDVELVRAPELRCLSLQGPAGYELAGSVAAPLEAYRLDELGHGGGLVLGPADAIDASYPELLARVVAAGGRAVSDAGFELARVRAGRPRFGRDFGEQQYPQEAGLTQLAVSFNKGCYLGQEVVCTLENRGRLTRRLALLEAAPGPLPSVPAELHEAAGQPVGQLTTAVLDPPRGHGLALGYVKNAQAAPGKQFSAGDSRFTLTRLVE
jgi:folate-binding protein YgfZ